MASFITLPFEIHFIIAEFLCHSALSAPPSPPEAPPQQNQQTPGLRPKVKRPTSSIQPIVNLIQALQPRPPTSAKAHRTSESLGPQTNSHDPHLLKNLQHTYTNFLATIPITIIQRAASTKDETLPDQLFGDFATDLGPGIFGDLFAGYKFSARTKCGGDGTNRAERLFWEVFLARWEGYLKMVRPCTETVVRQRGVGSDAFEALEPRELAARTMGEREAFELTTEGWIEVEIMKEAVRARRPVPAGLMLRRQVERGLEVPVGLDTGLSRCISRDLLSREFERLICDSKRANAVVSAALAEDDAVHDNG